ncbi:calcium-activated chloride channel regulator 1-like [Gallus gallus]|uniref:calcium-activated chloride channel regulator 1-like n=1 Tax=Gallus gallus TaxID=9031 RepID=UPI0002C880FF|nr:calcium-activated chloride channel regulator 1-like [Gallus gallus]|eukprot:XP_422360.3 calcium-activated chloride channel regulator 1-like [Gallus gallus]
MWGQGQIMGVFRSLIFLLSFQLLHVAKGSMVKLNESGYEDLVVAINPSVTEDANIILNTKAMIKDASNYLFEATKHRFFFKSVKIILPKTWKKNSTYSRLKTESYNKADVIIADPYLKYGDDPYTLQYGGCAMKGRYIHFTPNFLLDSSMIKVYGERGRVFVHEWAHLRWGVFDEYNNDAPFYVSENARVEPTRCSAGVTGKPVFRNCNGNQCTTRECQYDGQLYEAGCVFVPDLNQNSKNSIMYMQSLPSVVEFCDKNTHNSEAPNMQNKMCNYKSTWEIIMESDDFRNSSVVNSLVPPFETTFELLQTQDRAVSLVLDVSGSMNTNNRITNLRTAAEVFLIQIIEIGSRVGIVTFESSAYEKSPLLQITSVATRQRLVQNLPTTAGGGTKICAGIEKGLEIITNAIGTTYGSEIVLLTDGEDSTMSLCREKVKESGAIIHTIALGPSAAKELEEFSNITGGLQLYAVDVDVPSKLVEAFSEITTGSGDISEQSIQLESKDQEVVSSGWINSTVTIDKTVGNDTFFVFSWSKKQPLFFVRDPKGKEYGSSDFTIDSSNLKTARLSINGTAEVGDWHYYIQNVATVQNISVTVTSRAASSDVSPVILQAYMERANIAPNPVVVYAEVSQNFLPVLGATVIATIEKDGATAVSLPLFDNGAGADMTKNDGIYSRYFTSLSGDGRYSLKVSAQGRDQTIRLGRRQNRALYVPGYIENGEIQMNAPRPELADEEIQANLGSFSRTSTSSFKLDNSGISPTSSPQGFPPCKITDLNAYIENETVVLTWTAPGGDFDSGKADHYIIKSSANLWNLRDGFENATSVNSSHLAPQEAGSTETLTFKPEHLTIENGTVIYIAIRAVDDTNLTSDTSNIAKATWFVPPKASVPSDDEGNTSDGVNIAVIVAVVAGCVVLVCIIVSSTVCILQNKKKRKDRAIRM